MAKKTKTARKKRSGLIGTLERRENGIYYLRVVIKSVRVPDFKGGWKYKQIKKSWSTGTRNEEEAKKFQKNFVIPLQAKKEIERIEGLEAKIRCINRNVEEEERKKPALKVVDALDFYLDGEPDISEGTRNVYSCRWNRFVRFMDKRLGKGIAEMREVTPNMAEDFICELKKTTKGATFNGYLMLFKLLWKKLRKKAKLTCNPWSDYENRKVASVPRRNLTTDELKKVLSSLDGEWKMLFSIGLYTGMRLVDCSHLKWSAVNLAANELSVVMQKTKNRHPLPIPIPIHKDLFSLLSAIPQDKRTGYVVPECARAYDSGSINYHIKRIFANCGIETNEDGKNGRKICVAGFHSLRSGFVSMAADAGIPFPVIQAIVGHGSTRMTEHYYRTTKKNLVQCVEVIPSLIGDMVKPRASITLYSEVIDLIKSRMFKSETMDECLTRILGNVAPVKEPLPAYPVEKEEEPNEEAEATEATADSMRLAS